MKREQDEESARDENAREARSREREREREGEGEGEGGRERESHQVRACPRLFGAAQSQRTRESVSIDTSSTTDGTAS